MLAGVYSIDQYNVLLYRLTCVHFSMHQLVLSVRHTDCSTGPVVLGRLCYVIVNRLSKQSVQEDCDVAYFFKVFS